MSHSLVILDARGERTCPDTDGPWSLGGNADAAIVLPGAPDRVLAYIARQEAHCFIQPAAPDVELHRNGRRLIKSAWLEDGDRLSIGGHRLGCRIDGERLCIEFLVKAAPDDPAAPALQAPQNPPQAAGDVVAPGPPRRPPHGPARRRLKVLVYGASAVLLLAAGFVLFAMPVDIQVDPAPDRVTLDGFPPPLYIAGRHLALPGRYHVRARRSGYQPLDTEITVSRDETSFNFNLEKQPGRLSVSSAPVSGATVQIDGVAVGTTPLGAFEVAAGRHGLNVTADRYLPVTRELDIVGMGTAQQVDIALSPAWAVITVSSRPDAAAVDVDGQPAGRTPLRLELLAGTHKLTFRKPDYDTVAREIEVEAGVAQDLGPVELALSAGRIAFATEPAGATVTVDGDYVGHSPLELRLKPGQTHTLSATLPGFRTAQRELKVKPAEHRSLRLALEPEFGTVFIRTDPPDAQLKVDGQPRGEAVQRLRLTTLPHRLDISKPGYVPYTTQVTPRAGISAQVDITLQTVSQAKAARVTATVTTAAGQVLRLIAPGTFEMGASRREPGRRANERLRRVVLSRPFYLSEHAVTNAEFRRFKNDHDSGTVQGQTLNHDDQPAVSVGWDDAARYLNWLSARDKLAPAYREGQTHMVVVSPPATGYRLPTEAEWAYAARSAGRARSVRFAWGARFPPSGAAGNFADASARGIVPVVLDQYNDSYPVSAPVGRFPANPAALFDLGSNVAEWCQDFYTVNPVISGAAAVDPLGPSGGTHHVVRGASWRSASISRLRLSYRDYSAAPRNDLGFRIARYADSP